MQPKELTPNYHVSGQISPDDLPAIATAGIKTVICNRPDAENPQELCSEAVGIAARAAGLDFHVLELTHQTMTPDNVARQKALIAEAHGPVLAYCASGTRCSVVWALGAVRDLGVDTVLQKTGAAGYDLAGLRPALESIANAP